MTLTSAVYPTTSLSHQPLSVFCICQSALASPIFTKQNSLPCFHKHRPASTSFLNSFRAKFLKGVHWFLYSSSVILQLIPISFLPHCASKSVLSWVSQWASGYQLDYHLSPYVAWPVTSTGTCLIPPLWPETLGSLGFHDHLLLIVPLHWWILSPSLLLTLCLCSISRCWEPPGSVVGLPGSLKSSLGTITPSMV